MDTYLGPREGRFFGEGFKRVEHELWGIVVAPAADGEPTRVAATAGITFPAAWSTKGETEQRPHLSTIDVLVLSAQLTEAAIVHSRGLDVRERREMRLCQVRIRAGRQPQEEGLDEFPVWARVVASSPADTPGTSLTSVTCSIATLTVTCTVHHPTGQPIDVITYFSSLTATLGDPALRIYGAAYKAVRQVIGDVDIADDSLSGTATVAFGSTADRLADHIGLDAGSMPSMVDVFVTGLQLGQVLLYKLDRLGRADSNTLWMRHTLLEPGVRRTSPDRDAVSPVAATLENTKLLPLSGETWRSADIVARVGAATMRCSVAHLLPAIEATA